MWESVCHYVIQCVMQIGLTCIRGYGVCSRKWGKPVLATVVVTHPTCMGDSCISCIFYYARVFMLWPSGCVEDGVDGSSSQGGLVNLGQLVLGLYGTWDCTYCHRVLLSSVS
jgi:hypothetical protein